jgi:hypothetical protein
MKSIDLTNVQESTDRERLAAGPYVCKITGVEDVPINPNTGKGDYLRIHYDIAEGDFAGYYEGLREAHPDWTYIGTYIRSYKEAALGMFKRFCSAVSKSNGNYVFDGQKNADETTLVGKKVGLVLQEEEYIGNDGSRKKRLIVNKEFPINEIEKQKVPEAKLLPAENTTTKPDDGFMTVVDSEELPF